MGYVEYVTHGFGLADWVGGVGRGGIVMRLFRYIPAVNIVPCYDSMFKGFACRFD